MGLWTGLTASLLRQCTYGAARFGIYGWLKEEGWGGGGKRGLWVNGAVAGLVAGVVGAPAGQSELYPLFPPASSLPSPPPWCSTEIILVRMCSDSNKTPSLRLNYRNSIDGLFRIIREEGVGKLWSRGLGVTVGRSVVMNASQLSW